MDAHLEDAENKLVFDDDELAWGIVASVARVKEPIKLTRMQEKSRLLWKASNSWAIF